MFLEELEIMDYSLFLVIEHLKEPLPQPVQKFERGNIKQFDTQSRCSGVEN